LGFGGARRRYSTLPAQSLQRRTMQSRNVPARIAQPGRKLDDRTAFEVNGDDDAPFECREPPKHRRDRQSIDQIVDVARRVAALTLRRNLERRALRTRTVCVANVMHELAAHEQRRERLKRRPARRPVLIDGFDETDCADLLQIGPFDAATTKVPGRTPAKIPILRNETLARN
jgi:hypothetical protein